MFSVTHRDPIVNIMVRSAKGLMEAGEARKKYANDWRKIGQSLKVMVTSQNPDVADRMQTLCDLFGEIAAAEDALADDEIRNADDFRDIVERYGVLYRVNEEYMHARMANDRATEALKEATAKDQLESTKPTYERNRPKLLAAVEKAKGVKRATVDRLRDMTKALIEQRSKYTHFKVRKMIEGWTRYGTGMKRMCDTEMEVFQRIKDLLSELRSGGSVTHEAVDALERQIERQVSEAPAVAPPPQELLADAVAEE